MGKITINQDSLKPKREWKRHRVAVGHNVYRVLPPFGDSSNGYPYRKWMISWGLIDPETGRMRPFASSLTTEKRCPISEYTEALTKKADNIKAEMKTKGFSESEIKDKLKALSKLISDIRPKTVYAYNAINKAGEVGLLELKSTAHKKLKELMMSYIGDYNMDPTSLNAAADDSGVWFDFSATGEGFDRKYDVAKFQNKVKNANGKIAFEDDQSALPENVVQNYNSLAYDLGAIYQVKSYDTLRSILLANLKLLSEKMPEVIVEGFDDFADVEDIEINDSGRSGGGNTGGTEEVEAAPVAKPVGKKTVALKLDSIDDDDDTATVAPTLSNGSAKKNLAVDNDDIFAMADSILDS